MVMTTPTPHELAAAREILSPNAMFAFEDRVQYIASIIAKHRSEELIELKQVARHNADWFDSLVNDLSKIVESDKRPSEVISKVIELQRKAKALDKILEVALQMRTHQLPTLVDWVRFQFPPCAGNYQVEALLKAIESAMKEQTK
jgi:hypothetical protein